MPTYVLVPHSEFLESAVQSIEVDAIRSATGQLDLDYRITGDVGEILWPSWRKVARSEGLWQHSCLEAFVGVFGEPGYIELNFSTSGEWAAYHFSAHRVGMQPTDAQLEGGGRGFAKHEVRLRRSVRLPALAPAAKWRLGLAAVIEGRAGNKSYWALRHPPGAPDFHHDICFDADLQAPEPT